MVGAELMVHGVNPWLAALIAGPDAAARSAPSTASSPRCIASPSFIVTLATALLFRGAALALADGKQIAGLPADSSFFVKAGGSVAGMPFSVWVLIVATVVLTVVFTRTPSAPRSARSAPTPTRPSSVGCRSPGCGSWHSGRPG